MAPSTMPGLAEDVRRYVFGQAAETGQVPQAPQIAAALERPLSEVEEAIARLGEGKVVILAPHTLTIWAANPFAAVPTGFRVEARGRTYWGICIWDALGIPAALGADALVSASCGDCGEALSLRVREGRLAGGEGVVHFAVPASRWWENIGFA